MNPTDKTILKLLKESKEHLVRQFNSLMIDYKEYQSYFRKEDGPKAREKANLRYYCDMMDLLEVGPYEEGKFSLEHTSLNTCMEENRTARALLVTQIKDIKGQIKSLQSSAQAA